MGLFTHRSAPIRKAWKDLGVQGQTEYGSGQSLIDEGLTGLRSLDATYEERQKDPLGAVGRGIFTRARGNLADDFTRTVNSGAARRRQLATQTGGTLTPEQIAALDAQDRRDASEGLFRGETDLSTQEAGMTLTESGKLFDRQEGIRRTIGAVGSDEKLRGLNSIIQAIMGRQSLHFGNISAATSAVGTAFSAGIGASGANTGANNAGTYAKAVETNPWGVH